MRRSFFFVTLIAVLFSAASFAEGDRVDSVEFLDLAKANAEKQCDSIGALASLLGDSDSLNAQIIRQGARINCECTPKGVESAKARVASGELPPSVTRDEIESILLPAIMSSCAAEPVRSAYGSNCVEDFKSKVPNSVAYCACMAPKIAGLSDEQIYFASIQAKKDFDAKVAARESGVEAADPAPTLVGQLEAECLRQ
jgi:hypothetical protein